MNVTLQYGRAGLSLVLPDHWEITVLRKAEMPVLDDLPGALRQGLATPVASAPLAAIAAGQTTACILVCDITRPVPNGQLLPELIRTLLAAGIPAKQITVLVATGLHRPNEVEELRELIGNDWVLDTVQVVNHFARNDADHVDLGPTQRGTPVKIDRRFVDADVRIVTGLVEPHFMAGYSGGRKVITPGIAHADTITTVHAATLLEHPHARNCRLDGNPLHAEQIEIARRLAPVFAVNVVLDEQRRVSHLACGELEASHRAAVEFTHRFAIAPVQETFPTVITTSAGYPLDKTYYQAIKGIVSAQELLTPGGMLLLAAECSEGLGSPDFIASQRRFLTLGMDAFVTDILAKERAAIDEWQTELLVKALRRGRVGLYATGLSLQQHALTGIEPIADLQQAIYRRVEECGDPRVAIIPEGPYLIPLKLPESQTSTVQL